MSLQLPDSRCPRLVKEMDEIMVQSQVTIEDEVVKSCIDKLISVVKY